MLPNDRIGKNIISLINQIYHHTRYFTYQYLTSIRGTYDKNHPSKDMYIGAYANYIRDGIDRWDIPTTGMILRRTRGVFPSYYFPPRFDEEGFLILDEHTIDRIIRFRD